MPSWEELPASAEACRGPSCSREASSLELGTTVKNKLDRSLRSLRHVENMKVTGPPCHTLICGSYTVTGRVAGLISLQLFPIGQQFLLCPAC